MRRIENARGISTLSKTLQCVIRASRAGIPPLCTCLQLGEKVVNGSEAAFWGGGDDKIGTYCGGEWGCPRTYKT